MRQLPVIFTITIATTISLLFSCSGKDCVDGGYAYPVNLTNSDTQHFGYPIVPLMSSGDSLYNCFYRQYLAKAFGEPNLSLRPMSEPVYQLTYETAFGEICVFTLSSNEIVVKKKLSGDPFPVYDSTKITADERFHLKLLHEFSLPGDSVIYKEAYRKKLLDSIMQIDPKVGDPAYFSSLLRKAFIPQENNFEFETCRMSISRIQYLNIMNELQRIDYWKLEPFNDCLTEYLDGVSYLLEANTPCKYNFVIRLGCNASDDPFTSVCQQIINLAGFGNEIKLPIIKKSSK